MYYTINKHKDMSVMYYHTNGFKHGEFIFNNIMESE